MSELKQKITELKYGSIEVKIGAATRLGQMKNKKAIPDLIDAMLEGPGILRDVASEAMVAIGEDALDALKIVKREYERGDMKTPWTISRAIEVIEKNKIAVDGLSAESLKVRKKNLKHGKPPKKLKA